MTDAKLQELIETLKKQGIESGEESSRKILENAQKQADEILAKARSEADGIVNKAKDEADRQLKQLQSSMESAATLLVTNLKRTIEESLISLPLKKDLSEKLDETNFLKELITICVREYAKNPGRTQLDVLVSEEQRKNLGDFSLNLAKSLAGESKDKEVAIDLKSNGISFGFIINRADDVVSLDFTDEAFLELFLQYLSPRFREFFKTIDVKELSKR